MKLGAEARHERARLAGLHSQNADNSRDQRIAQAERDFRAARLAEHIRHAVAAAPPLTDEQVSRLRGLLAPSTPPEVAPGSP